MEDLCETNKEQFHCVLCPFVSCYKHNMRRHLRTVHRGSYLTTFRCDKCGQIFSNLEMMQSHVHRNCQPENATKRAMKNKKISNVEKKTKNDSSQGNFSSQKERDRKMDLEKQSHKILKCSTGGEVFHNITEFRPHVMKCKKPNAVKKGITARRMAVSPKSNTNQGASNENKLKEIKFKNPKSKKLIDPQKKRKIAKMLLCLICNYGSKYSWVLRKHMATKHNIKNAKIHRCKFCGEMFADGHKLAHHTGENYCMNTNKELFERRKLKVKRRRFNCSHCNYKAAYAHSVRLHLKRKHNFYFAIFHNCKICKEVFMGFQHLKNHDCQPSNLPKKTETEKQPKNIIDSDDTPEFQVEETIQCTATIENEPSGQQSEDPLDIENSVPSEAQQNFLEDSETVTEELCDPFFPPDEI